MHAGERATHGDADSAVRKGVVDEVRCPQIARLTLGPFEVNARQRHRRPPPIQTAAALNARTERGEEERTELSFSKVGRSLSGRPLVESARARLLVPAALRDKPSLVAVEVRYLKSRKRRDARRGNKKSGPHGTERMLTHADGVEAVGCRESMRHLFRSERPALPCQVELHAFVRRLKTQSEVELQSLGTPPIGRELNEVAALLPRQGNRALQERLTHATRA